MKRYTEKEIIKVKTLRRKYRYSYVQLSKLTGIPQTTIRNWCHLENIHTKWDTLIATNERRRIEYKNSELSTLSCFKEISPDLARIMAALLYWCEGAKYPATNRLNFANSDVELVKTFIYLLRKSFSLNESKFSVHLQIHDTHDYEELKFFWSRELKIPLKQFIRPTITSASGKKHRSNYKGTCSLHYRDYRIQLKLIGLYEGLVKKLRVSIY